MFASKHPLENTLVIELQADHEYGDEALELHGLLLSCPGLSALGSRLLSVIEAFHAGTSLERFERPVEQHSVAAPLVKINKAETEAEIEALIDRRVHARLATDAAYRNAENQEEASLREEQITDEECARFGHDPELPNPPEEVVD